MAAVVDLASVLAATVTIGAGGRGATTRGRI